MGYSAGVLTPAIIQPDL